MTYQLTSIDDVKALYSLCFKYKDDLSFDVKCGSRTIDGLSILGLTMLMGNTVTITAIGNENKVQNFYDKLGGIKC